MKYQNMEAFIWKMAAMSVAAEGSGGAVQVAGCSYTYICMYVIHIYVCSGCVRLRGCGGSQAGRGYYPADVMV